MPFLFRSGAGRRPARVLGCFAWAGLVVLAAAGAACRKSPPPPAPVASAAPGPVAVAEEAPDAGAEAAAPNTTDLDYWRAKVRQVAERDAADAGEAAPASPRALTVEPVLATAPRVEARFSVSRACEEKSTAAWKHFNEGAMASAESDLHSILTDEPNCAPARVMLGKLDYQRGELAAAIKEWESIRGLSPEADKALAALIAKTKKELGVESGLGQQESAHFLVTFDGRDDKEAARRTVEALEEARTAVGRALDYYPADAVPVILYPGEKFREADGRPAWADGLYDGKIRLASANAGERAERFKALLFHEYTHALVHRLASGKRVPAWLNEGLAQYAETLVPGARGRVVSARAGAWVPLTALADSFSTLDEHGADLAYAEARVAVEELVQRYRVYRIKELLERVGRGRSFEAAFEDTYLVPYERFAKGPAGR